MELPRDPRPNCEIATTSSGLLASSLAHAHTTRIHVGTDASLEFAQILFPTTIVACEYGGVVWWHLLPSCLHLRLLQNPDAYVSVAMCLCNLARHWSHRDPYRKGSGSPLQPAMTRMRIA
eukprot:6458063-Amphidinium_carterae.2